MKNYRYYLFVIIKLTATGMVDLANNQSSFTIHYAGKGSWFFDDLGDLNDGNK